MVCLSKKNPQAWGLRTFLLAPLTFSNKTVENVSFPERNHMFSTRYVLIWPKGRSVICGKAAGGSHLNSLPENEEIIWGLSGIAPDRARPPFFGVPQSPAVHAAGRFH